LQASVIFGLFAALGWLHNNPEQKTLLVQSLLSGKAWLVSLVGQQLGRWSAEIMHYT
jgi:hypothetical protein